MTRVSLPRFSAAELASLADPYPVYARLRAASALSRGGPAQWFVTRYAEVAACLRDPRLGAELPEGFRNFSVGDGPAQTFLAKVLGRRDPPDHTRLRALMTRTFTPHQVRALESRIGVLVDELLDRCTVPGEFDVVREIAFPLPLKVICDLIGIPRADEHLIRDKADALARAFAGVLSEADRSVADQAVGWMRGYIGGMLDERTAAASGDVLSRLLADADDPAGPTTRDEIVDNVIFLFFAGFETTMNLISSACALLSTRPAEFARLRADRGRIPAAVEEFLRFDAPFQTTLRFTREPVEIDGHRISRGRVVVLLLGSANHDERQFADPARLDLARDPNPHVSFGGGVHHCFGAALARAQARIVLDRLLDRCVRLSPAGEPLRRAEFRSYTKVPLLGEAS